MRRGGRILHPTLLPHKAFANCLIITVHFQLSAATATATAQKYYQVAQMANSEKIVAKIRVILYINIYVVEKAAGFIN